MKINKKFKAKLQKSSRKGGWTYVVWPGAAKFFGTHGLVMVKGKIDGHPFRASFMAMGGGQQMLPVKAEIRSVIGKEAGDTVEVVLEERIESARQAKSGVSSLSGPILKPGRRCRSERSEESKSAPYTRRVRHPSSGHAALWAPRPTRSFISAL